MKHWLGLLAIFACVLPISSSVEAQSSENVSSVLQNGLWKVHVNKQIQISADVTNGLGRDQPFAYIVQIQDQNGVTIKLSWLTGTLSPKQSLNPSQSWTPEEPGNYTAQIFVWSGIDNPDALSTPLSMKISVT